VEFPCAEYLPLIRHQLDERYPAAKWQVNESKQHEVTLKVPRPDSAVSSNPYRVKMARCKLVVQVGDQRLMWVTDAKHAASSQQHVSAWIDTELCFIYRAAQQSLQLQHEPSNRTTSSEI